MKTKKDINNKIKQLKVKLNNVKGTETEVYTRIVGYYRPVKNWNPGKREELKHKVNFKVREYHE